MEKVLKLYKDIEGEQFAFPDENEQIQTSDFTYSAQRMGGAPTISCTIMWNECLDNMWEGVYCEFNGERYHIAKTPSSSKDNTDARYKHNVQFVSDRIKLDSVLFYNKVEENKNPLNTSTEFSFWGNIASFAERLNKSLESSNLEYRVDSSGVTSEEKLFKAENMFISSALQEINKTYGLMYYFVGTTIHIGEQQSLISGLNLQYGFDHELLSISKNNKNNKVVTRITGHGSDENIPYYYPNPTEKGTIEIVPNGGNSILTNESFKITDQHKLASSVDLSANVVFNQTYKSAKAYRIVAQYMKDDTWVTASTADGQFLPHKYKETVLENAYNEKVECRMSYMISYTISFNENGHSSIGLYLPKKNFYLDGMNVDNFRAVKYATRSLDVALQDLTAEKIDASPIVKEYDTEISFTLGEIEASSDDNFHVIVQCFFDLVASTTRNNAELADAENLPIFCTLKEEEHDQYVWEGSKKTSPDISDFGVSLAGDYADDIKENPSLYVGEGFRINQTGYIQPSKYLMPSVYRKKEGNERFYPAQNNVYKCDNGEYIVFVNEFDESNPSEHVENFEDIKPTIKGVKNKEQEPIDVFEAFAYDINDNDEIDEATNQYIHPYFFGKLRALDFNLFDHAIDSGEMTISMTTGHCASCNFVIGVDDQQQKNLVQVDEDGNLLRDDNGNVIFGRKVFVDGEWVGQSATPQDIQNDTTNNSVWIALKKDTNTFGYIYPNANVKPSEGDNFVILHIDLPQTYITNAEAKLDAALIEFMRKNNAEEFDYSVKFSRIFWEENPAILSSFNENARVNVIYNGEQPRQMYVSSFTYKCSSNEALPEISVSLSKELNIGTNTIQSVVNELKDFEGTVSILEQQSRAKAAPAIRKDIDDDAYGAVTFHQKPTFKEGIQSDKAIKVGVGASEGFADGTGTYIDERKIQVRDLEVRGSLKVTDLVASQIHALDGEYYFTDTMKIERVVPRGDDDGIIYRLYFEKEHRNDFLKFYVNDILLSVVANIDDSEHSVTTNETGNAMRDISTESFMEVIYTSSGMADVLWADVRLLDNTINKPTAGAYVARRGNLNPDGTSNRTSSWSISVNDGRIVYYINQTKRTIEENLSDDSYGLAVGRLPDITPIRNAGAVGEIGVYAKYLLAQHLITVKWAGDAKYITLDKGEWDEELAAKGEYFYRVETIDNVNVYTRTKVEWKNCVWIATGNDTDTGTEKPYLVQEPSLVSLLPPEEAAEDWKPLWSIISGGDAVISKKEYFATTETSTQPLDDYDTDGLGVGGDEVEWNEDQSLCEYSALSPYMWKKTVTVTLSNTEGETAIELIGVYGETGLNAHIEIQEGNTVFVPCTSKKVVKEDFSITRKVKVFLDDTPIKIDSYQQIETGATGISFSSMSEDDSDECYIFTFSIAAGTELFDEQKLSFRFMAIDTSNGGNKEYTRIADFVFNPNVYEQAVSVNVSPSTLYIPVKDGKIASNGFARSFISLIQGEHASSGSVYTASLTYFGASSDYLSLTYTENAVNVNFVADTEISESSYAVINATLTNGMDVAVTVLQNISGRDATGEDAYSAQITPSSVTVPVTNSDSRILGSPYFSFSADLYKGSSAGAMSGTTVSTTYSAGGVIESISPNGSYLNITMSSGAKFETPITVGCTITNGTISRPAYITISPVKSGKDGEMGYTGPVQRVWHDKLISGQEYRNDSDSAEAIGIRYQDMIIVYCPNMESGYAAFVCKEGFTYNGETLDLGGLTYAEIKNAILSIGGYTYFEEVAINSSSAFFTQMIARNANIRMLAGSDIVMINDEQEVVAGISNAETVADGETGYHFWSGSSNPNGASFSVNKDGILYSKGGTFDGFLQTSFKKDDSDDDVQLEIANPNIACKRDKTYTLPSPSDDISGIHFVLIDNVTGGVMTTVDNFVSVNINGEGRFFGSEVLVNGTAYKWPKRIMFRSGILDFICYDNKWWVYNKNVEYLETDITSEIRKKERLGKQEVVFWGIVGATLARDIVYYENEDFEILFTGNTSYDFAIRASIPESEEYPDGAFDIVVTPRTSNNDQKNAIVHTTIKLSGEDGYSKTFYEWRIVQSGVGGADKTLPLDVKITYTPLSI